MAENSILLEIKGLKTQFQTARGVLRAVDGVDLVLRRNETMGIVGESGCGKSVMAMSIMGLIRRPPGRIEGEILFHRENGSVVDLAKLRPRDRLLREIRGSEIGMIFQDPMSSLTPVYTIGEQIIEGILAHERVGAGEARNRAIEMLKLVGIPSPERRVDEYPHELSGGMNQRAMIAMALSCKPSLLIADEPTTALDVTIQAQILELMLRLQEELRMSIMMITHDLGVVARVAHRVAVMYLGQVVEQSPTAEIFTDPAHPYTRGLLRSRPRIGVEGERHFEFISGIVPDPLYMPGGCRFADRCPHRMDVCSAPPPIFEAGNSHDARCWLLDTDSSKRSDHADAAAH
ncbi:ATP-binding cassette domain-containing protein [Devosia sp. D6-9]|nr:ATP-binding cassette domain-containing protein [Devosia sp. D6-9]